MKSEGSAFLDRAGKVVAADDAFRASLGLPAGEVTEALRALASADPRFGALLAGDGPDAVRLAATGGRAPVDVVRSRCAEGTFLHAVCAGGLAAPALEHAMHSLALARLAGGIAHDVKNPLNAMALQLALLTEKIDSTGGEISASSASHLASLRNQIGRVNDVVRRLADVADPPAGDGLDLGALAEDVATLFSHESRRRRVVLACEGTRGVAARADAGRAARVLLGLFWRGLACPEEGGRLIVRAAYDGDEAVLAIEHAAVQEPALAWIPEIAGRTVAELGGRFLHTQTAGSERMELRFRRENGP